MNARRQPREAAPAPRHPGEASSASLDPLVGTTFAGKYTIVRLLARGGVGLVYLARQPLDTGGEREVVVKVLAPNWIDNPEATARFEREGQRLGALQHANIVTQYECGHENGVAYLVMEHLVGELLSDYMTRKGRLTLEEFVPIAAQILKGLGYAHSRGLMHRDIKPSNIMLTVRKGRANFVKILDFGMAKLVAGERDVTSEQIVGTANYMAPEQIRGGTLDARVDVYSLGVLFYAMLAGRLPLIGDSNAALLYKHVHEAPTPLSTVLPPGHTVPEPLIALIHQCLAKDPEDRPADADAMVEALIDCLPASMFHLPVADGSVGVYVSSASMTAPSSSMSSTHSEMSSAELSRPRRPRTGEGLPQRPRTGNRGLRPRTAETLPPISALSTSSAPRIATQGITLETTPPPSRSWGLIIAAIVAVLAGGVVTAMTIAGNDPSETKGGSGPTATDEHRLAAMLDQVEAQILAGEFDRARRDLDRAAQELDAFPALRSRADRSRTRIAVASTLTTAQRLERDGNIPAALSAYKDILAIDARNTEALLAVKRLSQLTPAVGKPAEPADEPGTPRPGSKTGRPGKTGSKPVGTPPPEQKAAPPPEEQKAAPPQDSPFLPMKEGSGGGIFLPVGGNK